jgi:hypothetical protein
MVTMKEMDDYVIQIKCAGGGASLLAIQQALLLAISEIGSDKELAGAKDYREAVIVLSDLLKQCMLSDSQTNIGLGGHAYQNPN